MSDCHTFWILVCIPTEDGWERGQALKYSKTVEIKEL